MTTSTSSPSGKRKDDSSNFDSFGNAYTSSDAIPHAVSDPERAASLILVEEQTRRDVCATLLHALACDLEGFEPAHE